MSRLESDVCRPFSVAYNDLERVVWAETPEDAAECLAKSIIATTKDSFGNAITEAKRLGLDITHQVSSMAASMMVVELTKDEAWKRG